MSQKIRGQPKNIFIVQWDDKTGFKQQEFKQRRAALKFIEKLQRHGIEYVYHHKCKYGKE